MSGLLSAAPLAVGAGQFNLTGAVYVTDTELRFGFHQPPPNGDQMAGVLLPSNGAFADLKAGDMAHIGNLVTPAAGGPVTPGAPFFLANWIQLGNNINADLTSIPLNTSIPVCSGGAAADLPGSICRASAQSPIILEQGVTGVTAFLNVIGQAHYAGSTINTPLVGLLSANFTFGADSTISGLLADYTNNGFIMTGYSGNFSTLAASVPEPSSVGLLGVSLLAFGLLAKKNLRA